MSHAPPPRRAMLVLAATVAVACLWAPPATADPPTASFTVTPASPLVGQTVQFDASGSSDLDGPILEDDYRWDFDDDGAFDDAVGPTPTRVFGAAGTYPVSLEVSEGVVSESDTATTSVTVSLPPNKPPLAIFRAHPNKPIANELIELDSLSADPDGPIASQEWDLDADGRFDDARGAFAYAKFPAGNHRVALRVRDSRGAVAVAAQVLAVRRRGPSLLNPFPVVRLVGRLTRRGIRIRRLSVLAPEGARIVVRCRGRRCPLRRATGTGAGPGRSVRIRAFHRRLQGGLVLEIYVRGGGTIGKFTRFHVRRGALPRRKDACLQPGKSKPSACPAV